MAKDDYDVIVFKILTYLYALFKGKEIFEQERYDKAIGKKHINEESNTTLQIWRVVQQKAKDE